MVRLEDLAGLPAAGPDWDYDDRSWRVDVRPAARGGSGRTGLGGSGTTNSMSGGSLLATGTVLYSNASDPTLLTGEHGAARVTTTVTLTGDGRYQWHYRVENESFVFNPSWIPDTYYVGMLLLDLAVEDDDAAAAGVADVETNLPEWSGHLGEILDLSVVHWIVDVDNADIVPGDEGEFAFTSPPLPTVNVESASVWDGMYCVAAGQAGGQPIKGPGKMPAVSLTAETQYVPVNANRTSGSPWKKDDDGRTLTGLPVVRDFDLNPMRDLSGWNGQGQPPPGAAIADPQLKKMTATVTNGLPGGSIKVEVVYSDFFGAHPGGLIRLWEDQGKTQSIPLAYQGTDQGNAVYSGTLPDYPTCDFYVEGIRPSKALGDVTVRARYSPQPGVNPTDQEPVTVTPVINSFTRSIPASSVNFRNQGPPPNGLDGLIARSFTPDSPGIAFDANPTNWSLTIRYLQNVLNIQNEANGSAVGGVYFAGSGLANTNILPKVGSGFTFPGLDAINATDPTSPASFEETLIAPDKVAVHTDDSPSTGSLANFDKLDLKYSFRTYLVVKYSDDALYVIAYWDWEVNFYATTHVLGSGVSVIAAASKVTAAPNWVRSNWDPRTTALPIGKDSIEWR